ncbi:hypothetical protein [Bacillus mycoides]|uniref:hypothetical protein n=1 Tax=Bacillus mycoides TaxID=1405 RepID=UPI001F4438CD|nr:hypothetical protein [Bacillus mycoides]
MLEYIKNIEMSNWIAFFSIIVTLYIGIKSIKFAKDALEHSQRSMLVSESYKPIINDIKKIAW